MDVCVCVRLFCVCVVLWPPLWSSGQSFWLQIQRSLDDGTLVQILCFDTRTWSGDRDLLHQLGPTE
jgi:hypothetical protein